MPTYGTLSSVTFTSLDGAATNDRDESAFVDLTSSGADALIFTVLVTPSDTAGGSGGYIDFFFAGGAEASTTNLAGGATGADDSYDVLLEATHIRNTDHIGRLMVDGSTTGSTLGWTGTFVYTGPIPRYFSVVTDNQIGTSLSASAADNFVKYQTVDY